MYYLHYLRFNLDERQTLTKISTRKPLTTVPQTSARLGRQLKGKQQVIQKTTVCITGVCIIGGESEALEFHQETTEESGKHQELVLYKILHYFVPDYLHFGCMVLENIISTKPYFQHK